MTTPGAPKKVSRQNANVGVTEVRPTRLDFGEKKEREKKEREEKHFEKDRRCIYIDGEAECNDVDSDSDRSPTPTQSDIDFLDHESADIFDEFNQAQLDAERTRQDVARTEQAVKAKLKRRIVPTPVDDEEDVLTQTQILTPSQPEIQEVIDLTQDPITEVKVQEPKKSRKKPRRTMTDLIEREQGRKWMGVCYFEGESTEHNPKTPQELLDKFRACYEISYFIGQIERGHVEKRAHIQFYVELPQGKKADRKTIMKKVFTGWFERAKSPADAAKYCSKFDTRVSTTLEVGTPSFKTSKQGKRTDIEDAVQCIVTHGAQRAAIEHTRTFVRYHKGLMFTSKLISAPEYTPRITKKPSEVYLLYGAAGTGKSDYVIENECKIQNKPFIRGNRCNLVYKFPMQTEGSIWFDGFHHNSAVFEEFNGSQLAVHYFLQIVDEVVQCSVKGDMVEFAPERIYFTSNRHPKEWWPRDTQWLNSNYDAVMRRFTKIICFDRGYVQHEVVNGTREYDVFLTGPSPVDHDRFLFWRQVGENQLL